MEALFDRPIGPATIVQGSVEKVVPGLRECCRQSQAEVVSNIRNEIYQACPLPFSRPLYRQKMLNSTTYGSPCIATTAGENPIMQEMRFFASPLERAGAKCGCDLIAANANAFTRALGRLHNKTFLLGLEILLARDCEIVAGKLRQKW